MLAVEALWRRLSKACGIKGLISWIVGDDIPRRLHRTVVALLQAIANLRARRLIGKAILRAVVQTPRDVLLVGKGYPRRRLHGYDV